MYMYIPYAVFIPGPVLCVYIMFYLSRATYTMFNNYNFATCTYTFTVSVQEQPASAA